MCLCLCEVSFGVFRVVHAVRFWFDACVLPRAVSVLRRNDIALLHASFALLFKKKKEKKSVSRFPSAPEARDKNRRIGTPLLHRNLGWNDVRTMRWVKNGRDLRVTPRYDTARFLNVTSPSIKDVTLFSVTKLKTASHLRNRPDPDQDDEWLWNIGT